ncbi:hypothetical protein [Natronoglycomyces albus]|uniref:Uncharacterized protein n=1 Tax=Natronoglycomyces albus TaxID=2811108 RepID=A0A895XRI9_9ACTN|nr:hypothetical protein [Natronoglycomyces albus]QSB05176.1 hypothetical protein JQS30_15690 [Natronoglycomyces albus]
MNDHIEEPTWNRDDEGNVVDPGGHSPTFGEEGAWNTGWDDWLGAGSGSNATSASSDNRGSGAHEAIARNVFPTASNNTTYRDSHGNVVNSDQRVSGRDSESNLLYNGESTSASNSGANALKSATAPITAVSNTVSNVGKIDSLTDWGGYTNLITGLASDTLAIGSMTKEFNSFVENVTDPKFDPVQWLAGTLIDFLIQVFQPLEDLVGLVSGNESRMKESAGMWDTIATGCPEVGDYLGATGEAALADWGGESGDAARTRVSEAAEAVRGLGYIAVGLEALLMCMADLAKALRQDIVDLLAKGVSWALTRLLPKVAAGIATFGATIALAIADGIAKVASLLMKAFNRINQAIGIADKAATALDKINTAFTYLKPVLEGLKKHRHALNMIGGAAEQAFN